MTPPTADSNRLTRSLNAPAPARGRIVLIYATQNKPLLSGATVITAATIYDPHELVTIQFRSDSPLNEDRLEDMLFSSDPRTDAQAALRDTRVSGLTGLLVGLPANTTPIKIPISLRINRPITYYKHFAYNNSSGGAILQCILEIRMMGLR